jgi:molecular chaperone GrpE
MSDPTEAGSGPPGPVIRDRRRLDPETGQLRDAYGSTAPPTPADQSAEQPADQQDQPAQAGQTSKARHASPTPEVVPDEEPVIHPVGPDGQIDDGQIDDRQTDDERTDEGRMDDSRIDEGRTDPGTSSDVSLDGILADLDAAQASAAERLSDLQRLQAEFVNYRRRVDRDRDVARDQAVAGVLEALLPVLDDVYLARQHGDLEGGPFAAIAEKLDGVLQRFGLSRYGEQWEEFDPAVHEALMHTEAELPEGTETTTVVQVLQPGYRTGDRVLRAARVAVADPH